MAGTEKAGFSPNITVTHWSTEGIAPDLRFAAWSARSFPSLAQLFEIVPLEPFDTQSDHIILGGVVVQFGEGSARRYHRSIKRADTDGIDMLGVSILLTGSIEGRAAGRPFRANRRGIVLLDLTRPSRFVFGRSASIQLAVPRVLAERHLGALDDLHGLVIPAPRSTLLLKHLQAYRSALPTLSTAQGPLLAGIILDLLAVAIGRSGDARSEEMIAASLPSRIAAERVIESRLAEPSFSIEDICEAVRISRSTLYRLFEADGGIKTYIKRRRLDQVRQSLTDASNNDAIGVLAARWGFSNSSHLSRVFHAHFGVSPSDYRKASR